MTDNTRVSTESKGVLPVPTAISASVSQSMTEYDHNGNGEIELTQAPATGHALQRLERAFGGNQTDTDTP